MKKLVSIVLSLTLSALWAIPTPVAFATHQPGHAGQGAGNGPTRPAGGSDGLSEGDRFHIAHGHLDAHRGLDPSPLTPPEVGVLEGIRPQWEEALSATHEVVTPGSVKITVRSGFDAMLKLVFGTADGAAVYETRTELAQGTLEQTFAIEAGKEYFYRALRLRQSAEGEVVERETNKALFQVNTAGEEAPSGVQLSVGEIRNFPTFQELLPAIRTSLQAILNSNEFDALIVRAFKNLVRSTLEALNTAPASPETHRRFEELQDVIFVQHFQTTEWERYSPGLVRHLERIAYAPPPGYRTEDRIVRFNFGITGSFPRWDQKGIHIARVGADEAFAPTLVERNPDFSPNPGLLDTFTLGPGEYLAYATVSYRGVELGRSGVTQFIVGRPAPQPTPEVLTPPEPVVGAGTQYRAVGPQLFVDGFYDGVEQAQFCVRMTGLWTRCADMHRDASDPRHFRGALVLGGTPLSADTLSKAFVATRDQGSTRWTERGGYGLHRLQALPRSHLWRDAGAEVTQNQINFRVTPEIRIEGDVSVRLTTWSFGGQEAIRGCLSARPTFTFDDCREYAYSRMGSFERTVVLRPSGQGNTLTGSIEIDESWRAARYQWELMPTWIQVESNLGLGREDPLNKGSFSWGSPVAENVEITRETHPPGYWHRDGRIFFRLRATHPGIPYVVDGALSGGVTYEVLTQPEGGFVECTPRATANNYAGSCLFTPNPGFSGTTSFTYRASDGTFSSNAAQVTIRVDSPIAQPLPLPPIREPQRAPLPVFGGPASYQAGERSDPVSGRFIPILSVAAEVSNASRVELEYKKLSGPGTLGTSRRIQMRRMAGSVPSYRGEVNLFELGLLEEMGGPGTYQFRVIARGADGREIRDFLSHSLDVQAPYGWHTRFTSPIGTEVLGNHLFVGASLEDATHGWFVYQRVGEDGTLGPGVAVAMKQGYYYQTNVGIFPTGGFSEHVVLEPGRYLVRAHAIGRDEVVVEDPSGPRQITIAEPRAVIPPEPQIVGTPRFRVSNNRLFVDDLTVRNAERVYLAYRKVGGAVHLTELERDSANPNRWSGNRFILPEPGQPYAGAYRAWVVAVGPGGTRDRSDQTFSFTLGKAPQNRPNVRIQNATAELTAEGEQIRLRAKFKDLNVGTVQAVIRAVGSETIVNPIELTQEGRTEYWSGTLSRLGLAGDYTVEFVARRTTDRATARQTAALNVPTRPEFQRFTPDVSEDRSRVDFEVELGNFSEGDVTIFVNPTGAPPRPGRIVSLQGSPASHTASHTLHSGSINFGEGLAAGSYSVRLLARRSDGVLLEQILSFNVEGPPPPPALAPELFNQQVELTTTRINFLFGIDNFTSTGTLSARATRAGDPQFVRTAPVSRNPTTGAYTGFLIRDVGFTPGEYAISIIETVASGEEKILGNLPFEIVLPPVVRNQNFTGAEDTLMQFSLGGSDPQGWPLTFHLVGSMPSNGRLYCTTQGQCTFQMGPNASGTARFTYVVNNGRFHSNPATVTLTVIPVNDAPVLQGQTVSLAAGGLLAITPQATDIEGDSLNYQVVSGPAHGTVSWDAALGRFLYTPSPGFVGRETFTYKANDGQSDSSPATVTLQILDSSATEVPVTLNSFYYSASAGYRSGNNLNLGFTFGLGVDGLPSGASVEAVLSKRSGGSLSSPFVEIYRMPMRVSSTAGTTQTFTADRTTMRYYRIGEELRVTLVVKNPVTGQVIWQSSPVSFNAPSRGSAQPTSLTLPTSQIQLPARELPGIVWAGSSQNGFFAGLRGVSSTVSGGRRLVVSAQYRRRGTTEAWRYADLTPQSTSTTQNQGLSFFSGGVTDLAANTEYEYQIATALVTSTPSSLPWWQRNPLILATSPLEILSTVPPAIPTQPPTATVGEAATQTVSTAGPDAANAANAGAAPAPAEVWITNASYRLTHAGDPAQQRYNLTLNARIAGLPPGFTVELQGTLSGTVTPSINGTPGTPASDNQFSTTVQLTHGQYLSLANYSFNLVFRDASGAIVWTSPYPSISPQMGQFDLPGFMHSFIYTPSGIV